MEGRALDFVALGVLIFVVLTIVYGIIYIHDIPYEMAKKRNHPHQDAIHTAGWVSLFLMHTIWPFLWIWATMYKPEIGWGFHGSSKERDAGVRTEENQVLDEFKDRLAALEHKKDDFPPDLAEQIKVLSDRILKLEQMLPRERGES